MNSLDPERAYRLTYAHRSLTHQLDAGVRFLELDLYRDPNGGEFGQPLIRRMALDLGLAPPTAPPPQMEEAGIKVLHSPDDDYTSSCWTLSICLNELHVWSVSNPSHSPVIITFELKPPLPSAYFENHPDRATRVPFDADSLAALDRQLRERFGDLGYYPAELKGPHASLREAALNGGWPDLERMRGRFVFLLLETNYYEEIREGSNLGFPSPILTYVSEDPASRAMFVLSRDAEAEYAAFVKPSLNVVTDGAAIRALVDRGQVVQVGTENFVDLRRHGEDFCEAAFESGAQILVTDFPFALPEVHPHYVVRPPESGVLQNGRSPCVMDGREPD